MQKKLDNEKARYSSVSLPLPLIEKIKQTINGTGYSSVGSFVEDLVRTALAARKEEENKDFINSREKEAIKKRLQALGYIK